MTVLRCCAEQGLELSVNDDAESTQGFQRGPRGLDDRKIGRARIRHPGWEQRAGAIRQVYDEVVTVDLTPVPDHPDALTCARMVGVVNHDLDRLFLGSMT